MSSPKTTMFLVKVCAVSFLGIAWFIAPYDKVSAIYWAGAAGFFAVVGVLMGHALSRSDG